MKFLLIKAVTFITFICFANSSYRDAEILLRVKNNQLNDPLGKLDDWVESAPNGPCNWTGISCHSSDQTVYSIDLSGFNIYGNFPTDFCRISSLRNLNVSGNSLGGAIISDSISLCSHLVSLNLSSNIFVGSLPEFHTQFMNLTTLDFSFNNFSGGIPETFVVLPRLQFLSVGSNLLNASIPEFLSNMTELTQLILAVNPFQPSRIPDTIGRLTKLQTFVSTYTNLVGEIPDSIGDLSSIVNLDVSHNELVGRIPDTIGKLKNANQIEIFGNKLSGELPDVFSKLTSLLRFDASQNNLTGKIPESLARLHLVNLHLNDNFLDGEIPEAIALNPNLTELRLFNNRLSGSVPEFLGKNSDLEEIDVSGNEIEGPFPQYLCYRKKLRHLILFQNRISGKITESYGDCATLTYVRLQKNNLSGMVPNGMWSFTDLQYIDFSNNGLQGSIPPLISSAKSLGQLLISENKFSGDFPAEICDLPELRKIDSSRNEFNGELPSCITNLIKLQELHVQGNRFTGEIPRTVAAWVELTQLDLSQNYFSGNIPAGLGDLPVLTSLNLSNNLLSGEIPAELTKLKLNEFDASNNRLQGKVPLGFDNKLFFSSLMGNPDLCGPDLKQFRPCSRSKPVNMIMVVVLSVLALIFVVSLAWLIFKTNKFVHFGSRNRKHWKITSFQRLVFDEGHVLASLIDENLIGSGGSGRVYRVQLKSGQIVAAKRLWDEQDGMLKREVEILGRIRHANIVRLLFSYVNEDFSVLVYNYIENGSLGDALYGHKKGILRLDWPTRFGIAVGAAQGLAYLHHDCVPPIVHRDVKSTNILLDEELRAKIADFGVSTVLRRATEDDGGESQFTGSYGYIAPEYAYTSKITEKSDVYSFGVVLLELMIGRRANDESFGEKNNIVNWVTEVALSCDSEEESVKGINRSSLDRVLDPAMDASAINYEQAEKVVNVALSCTAELPTSRPSMRRVVELLKEQSSHPPNTSLNQI